MGADLIGFLVKGPVTLETDPNTMQRAIAIATASLPILRAYNEAFERSGLEDLPANTDFSATPHLDDAILECNLPVELPEKTPEEIVAEFVQFWTLQDARDLTSRNDPDDPSQQLLFAGELSWGDAPEGYAYTQLQLGLLLGLWDVFGIR